MDVNMDHINNLSFRHSEILKLVSWNLDGVP